jgi:hypothetical protein
MSKTFLMVIGVLVALMGLWGLAVSMGWLPVFAEVNDPWWHAALKVVLGGAAVYVASTDK